MNDILTITKQPIVEEDLGLENTPVIQFRDEKEVWVTPIKLFKIADNLEQLRVTDFNKFSQGVVFGGAEGSVGNNCFYKWFPESTEVESIPDVVTSKLSETGRWIKQDIGGAGGGADDFVTLDTEQTIKQNATKTWYNFNKFYGYNEAGQITLIKDNNSQNLKLTLCETDESSISAHFGYSSRTSQNLEIFNNLDGEIAVNRDIVFSDRESETFSDIGFIGYTRDNRDNLIIRNIKSDKVYIANSIVGTDPYYVPKFTLSSLNNKLQITNEASGEIELNRNLTFSGGRKNISYVATPTLAHQATPKDYVDTADQALDTKIQQNATKIETNRQNIAANTQTIQQHTQQIAQNTQSIQQNSQNISQNSQDIADTNSRLDAVDDKILQISGSSKIIGQINQTKDQVESNRVTILNNYVQQVKSRVPEEGDTVFTTDNYAYYYKTSWSQPYTISINIANTTTAGLVLSTANSDSNRGKIYVNPTNGVMQVIGQVAYLNTANTFTNNNTFNGTSFVVNSKSAQLNSFVEIGAAGGGSLQPTDHLISIDGGNGVGVPSRLQGKAVYSKDISLSNIADYEIINYKFVRDNLATLTNCVTIAGTQTITGDKTFNGYLYYSKTPTSNTEVANKQYVDSKISSLGSSYVTLNTTQTITGSKTFNANTYLYGSSNYVRNLYLQSGYTFSAQGNISSSGTNTFSGSNTFNGLTYYSRTPTSNTEVANKKYVDDKVAAGGGGSGNYVTLDTNQTITGDKTFNGYLYYSRTPTSNTEVANKQYVDSKTGSYVTTNTTQTITGSKTFNNSTTLGSTASHNIKIGGTAFFTGQDFYIANGTNTSSMGTSTALYVYRSDSSIQLVLRGGQTSVSSQYSSAYVSLGQYKDGAGFLLWGTNVRANQMEFNPISLTLLRFSSSTIIGNASFGTVTFALDPVWEQDYATANYVNQKLQQLYDHIDSRLRALEQAVNVPTTLADTRVVKAMIDNMRVPKSKITTLYEELDSLEGYEGLIGMSSPEERQKIFATDDRAEQIKILDEIKARKEEDERQRAEMEKQQQNEV